MTADKRKEESAETNTTAVTSGSGQEGESDAEKPYGVKEGEVALRNFEIDVIVEQERSEKDEQSDLERKDGAIEHLGEKDRYGDGKGQEGEEDDCAFCLYMKAGECGESFADWEACMDEGEKAGKDVVEKCLRVTRLLTQCMRVNADYYGPVMEAEKAMAVTVASGDGIEDASAQTERTIEEPIEVREQAGLPSS